jgi:hypothetical protein
MMYQEDQEEEKITINNMYQWYSHINHSVLYPYNKNILPVSFEEVNEYAGNVYNGKIIPNTYNSLIDPPIPDTFDEKEIKKNIKIARDLFEKYAKIPLIWQKEEQKMLILQTNIEIPIRYTYIQNICDIEIKTTNIDTNGNNIWIKIPKKNYDSFIISENHYLDNKIKINYFLDTSYDIDISGYSNISILLTRGIAESPENIPDPLKRGLIMHTLGLLRGDLYEGTTTCEIEDLYNSYLPSKINFIW